MGTKEYYVLVPSQRGDSFCCVNLSIIGEVFEEKSRDIEIFYMVKILLRIMKYHRLIIHCSLMVERSRQEIKETVKERHLRQSPIPVLIENQRKTLKRNREKLNNLKI